MAVSESTARRYELQDPDVRLMLRVRADDAAAFNELMVRYQERLVTVLEHLTGRRNLGEDLSQEVFLRVYRARKRYVPAARFSTWIFTIANHVAANALRTRARRPEVDVARNVAATAAHPLERIAEAASGLMPNRQALRTELRAVVQQAMGELSPRQRMAVLLSKFEGMNYLEIGQAMELSPQAVKSLLARARENLRESLEPYWTEGRPPSMAGPVDG